MTTNLEEVLRSTLADPRRRLTAASGQLAGLERAVTRRRRARAGVLAGAATVVLVAGIVLTTALRPAPQLSPSATPSPGTPTSGTPASGSPSAVGPDPGPPLGLPASGLGEPLALPGRVVDAALAGGSLWALTAGDPARAVRLDPHTGKVTASVPLPPGEPGGLRVDPAIGAVWVWTASDPSGQGTTLARIEPGGAAPAQTAVVVGPVRDAAVGDGAFWFGTGSGVFSWRAGADPAAVPGLDLARTPTAPAALAFDAARRRLLVGLEDQRLLAVDARTGRTAAAGSFGYGKGALALTSHGELWAGGYIGDGPTVRRIDPGTLALLGTSPLAAVNGPGAWVWPGEWVVWVRNGGDSGLTCIAADSGQPLQRWDSVQGPVTGSQQDGAFAVHEGRLYRLPLAGGCTG